jgi:hypothetical protein
MLVKWVAFRTQETEVRGDNWRKPVIGDPCEGVLVGVAVVEAVAVAVVVAVAEEEPLGDKPALKLTLTIWKRQHASQRYHAATLTRAC